MSDEVSLEGQDRNQDQDQYYHGGDEFELEVEPLETFRAPYLKWGDALRRFKTGKKKINDMKEECAISPSMDRHIIDESEDSYRRRLEDNFTGDYMYMGVMNPTQEELGRQYSYSGHEPKLGRGRFRARSGVPGSLSAKACNIG